MANVIKKFKTGIGLDPVSADPGSPITGQLQYSDGTARTAGTWQYNGSSWEKLVSGTAGNLTIVSKTANYTITTADDIILVDSSGGTFTLTLPTAVGNSGDVFIIQKTDSSATAVTIDGNGSETINGNLTTTVNTQYESLKIVSNGSNWLILERKSDAYLGSFTPTGSWSGTTTYYGDMSRSDNQMVIRYTLTLSGSATATGLTLNMPSGYTIDTNKLPNWAANDADCLVDGLILDSGTGRYNIANALVTSSSTITLQALDDLSSATHLTSSLSDTFPITFASGDKIIVTIQVPISGWKSQNE